MPTPEFDVKAYVETASASVGLTIPEDRKQTVIGIFQVITGIADKFLDIPVTEQDEPAPVFRP